MFESLKGCRVLVTGASSGIGASIACTFGRFGSTVGVHYYSGRDRAEIIASEIEDLGGSAYLIQADLTDPNESKDLIERFIESAGCINVLVNNAGAIYKPNNFLELDMDAWNATLALDLTAPYILGREAFRYMKDHGGGKIITISSIAAKYGGSETSIHYGAAKAGVEAVTRSFSRFGAKYNILTNIIQAGVIHTPLHEKIGRVSLEDRISRIPLGRAGRPEEIAMVCAFLASEHGDYITGQTIGVTGGD